MGDSAGRFVWRTDSLVRWAGAMTSTPSADERLADLRRKLTGLFLGGVGLANTGVIAVLFLLVHLWHLHWLGKPLGGGLFNPEDASASASGLLKSGGWWMLILYYVGIPAACFHFANGIWTSLITWGIAIGPNVTAVSSMNTQSG